MRKILSILAIALLAGTSTAAAQTVWDGQQADPANQQSGTYADEIGSTIYRVSTNVYLVADGSATEYSVVAAHLSGDKSYSSTSADPAITEADFAAGADFAGTVTGALPALPSADTTTTTTTTTDTSGV